MKATVNRKALVAAVNAAADAVDRRSKSKILQCVKLAVGNGVLTLTGTDLEIARVRVVGKSGDGKSKPGLAAVNAVKLKSAMKGLKKGASVTLETEEGGWLGLESGGARARLAVEKAEFPPIPEPDADWPTFKVRGRVLGEMIRKTAFCASTDEGRVNLNGCLLERGDVAGGQMGLRMVATDGHRLAVAEAPDADGGAVYLPTPMLIPRRALGALAEMAGAAGDDCLEFAVKLGESGRCVSLVAGGAGDTLTVRLIDKEFPDYGQVIPDEVSGTFQAEADELAAALKAVTAISSDRSRAVKFECASNLESLKLSARNYDREESVRSVRVSGLSNGFDPVGFNAKYLLEALGKARGGTVEFGFGVDCLAPWKMENVCDPLWRYVVMPMRATW